MLLISQSLYTLSGWLYAALVLACVLTALLRKQEPASALGWSLAIVFLPGIGVILYLTFGFVRISRRLRRKIEHHRTFGGDKLDDRGAGDRGAGEEERPDDRWGRLSRVMEELGQGPRRAGNATELYVDGGLAYEEMERAIRAARHHVHVEFYIFRDDEVGRNAIEVLCEKVREGVEVRLILDGAGSFGGSRIVRPLRQAGGEVAWFLPLFSMLKLASPNLRNHRKIVICDGRVAFFGGLNVGAEYLGRRRARGRDWADFHMRIAGPSVADLQWMFVEDWDFCTGVTLDAERYFPPAEEPGCEAAQVIAGGPDLRPNPVRQAFLAAFLAARRRILIVTPYLVPDMALREVLMTVARTGVDVRILTQFPPPDSWMPYLCALSFCEELNEAGVRVLGYQPGIVHAKAVVVDSEWAMLGTANLDNRSMFLNFEQMTLFDGGHPDRNPARIEAAIERLLADSVRLDRTWIESRPLRLRLLMRVARLFAPLF